MIELFAHNQTAYDCAVSMLSSVGRAAIVHPTGTGKSFIAFKLCEENPEKTVCWLSPSEYIFKTQLENLAQVTDGFVPENIRFFTYARTMHLTADELSEIRPDYIILDEFHRCGAQEWGRGVAALLAQYPAVPTLGLSATAIRYLDNQRDMADELFGGNIASEMTLGEAIVRGILAAPKYVTSVYSYREQLEKYELRVQNTKSRVTRDVAAEYLEALRRALSMADGLDVVFARHMTERNGKYIVFCASYAHLCEAVQQAPAWFARVDSAPHIYTAYSDDPAADEAFTAFKNDESAHLKLLFCIDMLNEGVHVSNVSGVILLRPTVSPTVYKQQIGRALAAGKREQPVIFDIVLNIENLCSIGAIEEEMEAALTLYRARGDSEQIVQERFVVTDELRDCVALFDALNGTLSASWEQMYDQAAAYYAENGDLDVPKRYVTAEGYTLGAWLNTQRLVRAGKIAGHLRAEQCEKLDAIGMRWESVRDRSWEKNFAQAKAYFAAHGDLLVDTGEPLGRWLSQLRSCRKAAARRAYLTEERIAALDEIGMIWDIPDYRFEKNLALCRAYRAEHGNLDVPAGYVAPDGTRLGAWAQNLRTAARGNTTRRTALREDQRARLDALGFIWKNRRNAAWDEAFCALEEYKKEHGDLDVPPGYVTKTGFALGRWLKRQIAAPTLSAARRKKLETLGVVWKNDDAWMQKFRLAEQYCTAHKTSRIPQDYVADGVWVGRWLTEQIARLNHRPTGRTKTVKPLTREQADKLHSLGIVENLTQHDIAWQEQYASAKAFFDEFGHLHVPPNYVGQNGKNLDRWLRSQRKYQQEGKLTPDQLRLLSALHWEKVV